MSGENTVKNKVKVKIAGSEFTVVSEESESYTLTIAEEINENIKEIQDMNKNVSSTAALILTALNYCDEIRQSKKECGRLSTQLEKYFADTAKDKEIIAELRAENEKLKKDADTYRKRLGERSRGGSPVSSALKTAYKTVSVSEEEAAEDENGFFSEKTENNSV